MRECKECELYRIVCGILLYSYDRLLYNCDNIEVGCIYRIDEVWKADARRKKVLVGSMETCV